MQLVNHVESARGVVYKYGGTSVATPEKIKAVAKCVARVANSGRRIVVVASAMGGTTDALIALAKQMGDVLSPREMDALLSTGEQQTVSLIAMALNALGVPAMSMTGWQCGVRTNGKHTRARITAIDTSALERCFANGVVPVVAGFQGIDAHGDITTLGRGGSDTTAVALAAALGFDCDIYTDVDGVYTADPNRVTGARKLDAVSYDDMIAMAQSGAKVLETRSVEIAKKHGVKLFVGRALCKDKTAGTYITENGEEDAAAKYSTM
ncbi:MAG: aspartate kinase [Eubacteriales bacterium]|nr:aspartate kinase [Eubacteriales bacterium]